MTTEEARRVVLAWLATREDWAPMSDLIDHLRADGWKNSHTRSCVSVLQHRKWANRRTAWLGGGRKRSEVRITVAGRAELQRAWRELDAADAVAWEDGHGNML